MPSSHTVRSRFSRTGTAALLLCALALLIAASAPPARAADAGNLGRGKGTDELFATLKNNSDRTIVVFDLVFKTNLVPLAPRVVSQPQAPCQAPKSPGVPNTAFCFLPEGWKPGELITVEGIVTLGLYPQAAGAQLIACYAPCASTSDLSPPMDVDGPFDLKCAGKSTQHVGTPGRDVITGTSGPDVIAGQGGNDKIDGKGGKDIICGGGGKDRLFGGAGIDWIAGNGGADRLFGGGARDKLYGQGGGDDLFGGGGGDWLFGGAGRDLLNGGSGKDRGKGGPGRDRAKSIPPHLFD